MSIGTNIKKLRRDNDITQEELAEYLGITAKAVSQWETDRTVPDISLLPALCHIFDVSSDMLLGIDVQKNNENIQKYLDEELEAEYSGNFEKKRYGRGGIADASGGLRICRICQRGKDGFPFTHVP